MNDQKKKNTVNVNARIGTAEYSSLPGDTGRTSRMKGPEPNYCYMGRVKDE